MGTKYTHTSCQCSLIANIILFHIYF